MINGNLRLNRIDTVYVNVECFLSYPRHTWLLKVPFLGRFFAKSQVKVDPLAVKWIDYCATNYYVVVYTDNARTLVETYKHVGPHLGREVQLLYVPVPELLSMVSTHAVVTESEIDHPKHVTWKGARNTAV